MKKRVIGGTVFFVLCFLSLIFSFFDYLCILFAVIGVCEIISLSKTSTKKFFSFMYVVYFLISIYCLIALYNIKPIYIFVLISGIMLNDTFAFFSGKRFGKRMLNSISPNKTIEGLYGGIIATMVVYVIYLFSLGRLFETKYDDIAIAFQILINIITLLFGVIGDLLESKLKRISNKKDSGTIIYGHGGLLDRIDSWLLSGMFFYMVIILFI